MAVTRFKFPRFSESLNVEIPKRLWVRAVVVYSTNYSLLTLQDNLNPDLSFIFGKMQGITQYSRVLRYFLLWQDYSMNVGGANYIDPNNKSNHITCHTLHHNQHF